MNLQVNEKTEKLIIWKLNMILKKVCSVCCFLSVYLYAEATENPNRKSLPFIRQGEYEGLPEKVNKF